MYHECLVERTTMQCVIMHFLYTFTFYKPATCNKCLANDRARGNSRGRLRVLHPCVTSSYALVLTHPNSGDTRLGVYRSCVYLSLSLISTTICGVASKPLSHVLNHQSLVLRIFALTPLISVKVKLSRYRPGQALGVPGFLDNRNTKVVRLSALRTGRLYFAEKIPGISIKG